MQVHRRRHDSAQGVAEVKGNNNGPCGADASLSLVMQRCEKAAMRKRGHSLLALFSSCLIQNANAVKR